MLKEQLHKKISLAFNPIHLEVHNESHMHSGPATDSHFRLIIVSEFFLNQSRIDRQRQVNELLAEEVRGPIHALAQHCYTPEEWAKLNPSATLTSPECSQKQRS